MKDIETTNALLEDRDQNDMLISTELLISMLFANTRAQLTHAQLESIGRNGEEAIVRHQVQMMLNLTVEESQALISQYLGDI